MVHIINNILDLPWLLLGGIVIVVLIAILTPWKFVYEVILLTLAVAWVAFVFFITEGHEALKRILRKRHKRTETIDSDYSSENLIQ